MSKKLEGTEKDVLADFKALMKAIKDISPMHYMAYTEYMKMTDGNEDLSIKLANGIIESIFKGNRV